MTRLVELMAGTAVNTEFPPRGTDDQIEDVVLSAHELKGTGFGPVSVQLRSGEILGIAGADNNGQLALLRSLAGADPSQGVLTAGRTAGHRSAVGPTRDVAER